MATAAVAAVDAGPQKPDRLPEDPPLGAKATAQWREHLIREERERKLRYDRDRMKDHRAVVRFLVSTRARLDRAGSKASVAAIRARLPTAIEGVRQRITRIDHWGTNSNLLGDYDAMLKALADAYPEARVSWLTGDRAPLTALRVEMDRRQKTIKDWLAEAARTEDE